MFIRTIKKRNKYSPKVFEYQYLCDSLRTDKGPRQRFLLNLGKLDLSQEEWPFLAKRIDEILRGQEKLFAGKPEIDRLANDYAQKFLRKYEVEYDDSGGDHYENVDVDSVAHGKNRSAGAEHICLSYLKKLRLDQYLLDCGLTPREAEVAVLLIVGRLVSPGSERHTRQWAQNISALDELLETDFRQLSLNSLYHASDLLYDNKEIIESRLSGREKELFGLDEKIVLYDLTNTYFEGRAAANSKAKFGRSKDKRSDCRLLTLGLILDGDGFPKKSKIFSGNQSEPGTLKDMLKGLGESDNDKNGDSKRKTVVLDAGIGTEENLAELKDEYDYICVSRKKMEPPLDSEDFIVIKQTKENRVEAKRVSADGEVFLYCKSDLKAKKEKAMQTRLEQLFEERLRQIRQSLRKKGGVKRYDKVMVRIGRLREKYKSINRYYDIDVAEENGLAIDINWSYVKEQSDQRFSGGYYLRTNRADLSEKEIWNIYTMLNEVEDGFRALKSELNLRPIFHKKENRSDAHLFIAVLAYHILRSVQTRLKRLGLNYRWATIRKLMQTHQRSTIRFNTKDGKTIHIRKCSEPESFHRRIYDALQLEYTPCKAKKTTFENT